MDKARLLHLDSRNVLFYNFEILLLFNLIDHLRVLISGKFRAHERPRHSTEGRAGKPFPQSLPTLRPNNPPSCHIDTIASYSSRPQHPTANNTPHVFLALHPHSPSIQIETASRDKMVLSSILHRF